MSNLYIFLFDLDYGVEETYQEVVEADNIEAAWDKIKLRPLDESDPDETGEDRLHGKEEVDVVMELFPETKEWNHWAWSSTRKQWEMGHWGGHRDGADQPFHYRGKYKFH